MAQRGRPGRLIALATAVLGLSLGTAGRTQDRSGGQIPLVDGAVGCLEMSLTTMRQLPRLFMVGRADSAGALLEFWEQACGSLEPILRGKRLAEIWTGTFHEDEVDGTTLAELLAWPPPKDSAQDMDFSTSTERSPSVERSPLQVYRHDLQAQQLCYDTFTSWLAARLQPSMDPGSTAELICHHYATAGDLISQLGREPYAHSRLRKVYVEEALQARWRWHSGWALYAGIASEWLQGSDRTAYPLLGFRFGFQGRRRWVRASVELGGGVTSEAPRFWVAPVDSVEEWRRTDSALALEFGRSLVVSWHHTLDLGVGVGYGARLYHPVRDFEAISGEAAGAGESVRIRNAQAFLLLGYGYHFGRWGGSVFGLELKYTCGRFQEHGLPAWFRDDWSLRLVYARNRLKGSGG